MKCKSQGVESIRVEHKKRLNLLIVTSNMELTSKSFENKGT